MNTERKQDPREVPYIVPFPLAAGHPANHGYTPCADCGVQRPAHCLGPFSRACLYGCAPQTVTGNHLVPGRGALRWPSCAVANYPLPSGEDISIE